MYYRQTAKWAESLLKFMWPVNHFHCIDVYIHTYIQTYIHTYMHTYTHAKELRQFRADIHTYVHTGSSILRPSFTHMPVTHASVPGCSAPNALLLPAIASQSKGLALAALAWQRGQHVHGHQSTHSDAQLPASFFLLPLYHEASATPWQVSPGSSKRRTSR